MTVVTRAGVWERFDEVILATHADQALAMLADATPTERAVLGAFRFQRNEAFLHTDETVLPRRRRAWASWNYHIPAAPQAAVAVTYWLNRLQTIQADQQFCVTLNDSVAVDPARVLRRITYHHPVYSAASVAAQRRHAEISGVDRIHFCGAYWGYGFHEDGVNSALAVLKHFGKNLTECKAAFTKAESATVASVR